MILVLDSSVVLTAVDSQEDAAFEVIEYASPVVAQTYSSPYILSEVRSNLRRIGGTRAFALIEEMVGWKIAQPTAADVEAARGCTHAKDAPVVALAQRVRADYLISLDRRHLVRQDVMDCTGLNIVTPEEFLQAVDAGFEKAV